MRLIDVDVLKSHIKAVIKKQNGGDADLVPIGELLTFIGMEPTAYDVDAVVKQLEKEKQTSASAKTEAIIGMCGASANHYSGEACAYQKAIEIVKGGGIDAKTNS